MTIQPRVLVLSEDLAIRQTLLGLLPAAGFSSASLGDIPAAILVGCRASIAEAVLAAAQAVSRKGCNLPLILVTSQGSEDLAIEALRRGMSNYLRLPLTAVQLGQAIEPLLAKRAQNSPGDCMIGAGQAFRGIRNFLLRVATFGSNVLITGETGTGKELAADFIHSHSARAARPFVRISCAAIPDSLIESELFGFERGAFTGALASQDGKFKLAHGGAVFLDEVGDLSPYAQAKILRVIETGEIQRLGGKQPHRTDVRIIAATNQNLEANPGFRKDLYYRLNVARIHLPPLRERSEDILPLAESFRAEFDRKIGCTSNFTAEAKQLMLAHQWPGNIRELRNIVEAAFIDPGPGADGALDLPPRFVGLCRVPLEGNWNACYSPSLRRAGTRAGQRVNFTGHE